MTTDKQIITYSGIGSGRATDLLKLQKQQLIDLLKCKEQECEKLKEKLSRKKAVVDFACCPSYGYNDNAIEPTRIKTFCYEESCEYKTMIKYEQALREIKEIADLSIVHFDIDYLKQAINEILQKISEVTNDR